MQRKIAAKAGTIDETSLTAPDVDHATGDRFSLLRQEPLSLDLGKYLEQWFETFPIGMQPGDFLQLRHIETY